MLPLVVFDHEPVARIVGIDRQRAAPSSAGARQSQQEMESMLAIALLTEQPVTDTDDPVLVGWHWRAKISDGHHKKPHREVGRVIRLRKRRPRRASSTAEA